jgi:hypothetical protein
MRTQDVLTFSDIKSTSNNESIFITGDKYIDGSVITMNVGSNIKIMNDC